MHLLNNRHFLESVSPVFYNTIIAVYVLTVISYGGASRVELFVCVYVYKCLCVCVNVFVHRYMCLSVSVADTPFCQSDIFAYSRFQPMPCIYVRIYIFMNTIK